MKLQCDLCREIVVAQFSIVGDAIEVRCPECEKTFRVPATKAGEVTPIAARPAGTMHCPKCGDDQPPASACRSCGLLADRMPDFARDQSANVSEEVAAAWRAVEASWSDDAAHDRFVEAVSVAIAYPWAAQRYREALRLRPDDRRAADQLARIARMAEVTLLASATKKTSASQKPYRNVMVILTVLVVLLIVGVGVAIFSKGFLADEQPPLGPAPTQPAHR